MNNNEAILSDASNWVASWRGGDDEEKRLCSESEEDASIFAAFIEERERLGALSGDGALVLAHPMDLFRVSRWITLLRCRQAPSRNWDRFRWQLVSDDRIELGQLGLMPVDESLPEDPGDQKIIAWVVNGYVHERRRSDT